MLIEYFYIFILTTIYLINSQMGLPSVIVLSSTSAIYLLLYIRVSKRHSQLVAVSTMMIASLPFSWNPVWGASVGASIITWYYLWTGVAIILVFAKKNNSRIYQYQKWLAGISLAVLIYSAIPLVKSRSISEGVKEYLMIGIFLILLLGTNIKEAYCTKQSKEFLVNIYIFTMFLISTGMLIQYIGFRFFEKILFGFKTMYSWGGKIQTGCHLLMDDASSGTIMLGVGGMLGLINRKQNRLMLPQLVVIVIGMACSGRRTGALSLFFVMGLYFIIGIKSIKGKITSIVSFGALSIVLLYFMSASRAVTNLTQMFDNNGRFQLWQEGMQLFMDKPLLGYGFDNVYLEKVLMPSKMIVHNTVIRWLDMGGIFYGILMALIFLFWILLLHKKHQYDFMWGIIYSCIAGMLIPDLLNARFIFVLVLISLMSVNGINKDMKIGIQKYENNFNSDNSEFK